MSVPASASNDGIINASADTVWKVLTNWGALMDWYPNDPEKGLVPLLKTELEGKPGDIPLTRLMYVPDNDVPIPETLERQDDVSRRIYYSLPNEGALEGVRNYWATTQVQPISENQCKVSCASFFDVDDPDKVDELSSFFRDVVYGLAVIGGLKAYCEAVKG